MLRVISEERVTVTLLVPTMLGMMLAEFNPAVHDLASLNTITYGASPMPSAMIEHALRVMPGVSFTQAYGMTELAPVATVLEAKHHALSGPYMSKLRSAGRATQIADVKVADADDREVPRGTVGQILVRGPGVMKGYWNQPELTAETLRGGWMHTGDAGYMDDEGFLYVVDRIKDMIITGGENVYSAEVENAICKHTAVAMCAVVGIPHEKWGEQVHAILFLKPGQQLTEGDVLSHCRTLIAGFKCPRSVEFRTEPLPISGAGKILKRQLRRLLAGHGRTNSIMNRNIFEQHHALFRDSFRRFVAEEIVPHHEQWEQDGEVSRDVWKKAGEYGFLCMAVPEQYGGVGTEDFRFNTIITEELRALRDRARLSAAYRHRAAIPVTARHRRAKETLVSADGPGRIHLGHRHDRTEYRQRPVGRPDDSHTER